MAQIRSIIRAVIFSITGIIVAFLIIRIGLDLVNADRTNTILSLLYGLTDFLISPFDNIIVINNQQLLFLNVNAILAVGIYVFSAVIVSEIITGFTHDNVEDIVQNVVDGMFKFLELTLGLRIVFELFGVLEKFNGPVFVRSIYALTKWSQLFPLSFPFGSGYIDLAAIIVLIFVVAIDIISEKFISALFARARTIKTVTVRR